MKDVLLLLTTVFVSLLSANTVLAQSSKAPKTFVTQEVENARKALADPQNSIYSNGMITKDRQHLGCGQDELHLRKMVSDPQYAQRHADTEKKIYEIVKNQLDEQRRTGKMPDGSQILNRRITSPCTTGGNSNVVTIPVVVHVMHLPGTPVGTAENISTAQIQAGIQHLNDAFRDVGVYAPGPLFSNSGITDADMEIEFCLAVRDPSGNAHAGINRIATNYSNLFRDDIVSGTTTQDEALKALSFWDSNLYMNVWLVNEICTASPNTGCGVAGYAYLASAHGQAVDGVVNEAAWWGSSTDNSKVHIHEVGHYLDLEHTFNDHNNNGSSCENNNCLTEGDFVCDTPPDAGTVAADCQLSQTANTCATDANDPSPNNPFTTDVQDIYEDYMDYGFQYCQNTFTPGQKARARAALFGVRSSLLTSLGCTPVVAVEANLSAVVFPTSNVCGTTFAPIVTLTNNGTGNITSAVINHQIDGGAATSFTWTGTLAPGASINITLPNATIGGIGAHNIYVTLGNINGSPDSYTDNNVFCQTFSYNPISTFPYCENFSAGAADWSTENPDGSLTWGLYDNAGAGASCSNGTTAFFNAFNYNTSGAEDYLVSPVFNLSSASTAILNFDVAHRFYGSPYIERLRVEVSTDCGNTFVPTTYDKQGATLATVGSGTTQFFPITGCSDWRNEVVNLSAYAGNASVIVRFRVTNGWGNNLFLDNICLTTPACEAPTAATLSTPTPTSLTATWTAPATTPDGYVVQHSTDGGTNWTTAINGTHPWINELHYDNSGTDANEGFEIAGPSGMNLACYTIFKLNGSPTATALNQIYGTIPLTGIIDDEGGTGFGALGFILSPADGLQLQNGNATNNEPDGIALVYNGGTCGCPGAQQVVQFLSYEGTFIGLATPLIGVVSTLIPTSETGTTTTTQSMQLGAGCGDAYNDFTWLVNQTASNGTLNTGQVLYSTTNTSLALNQLQPCTPYQMRVKSYCCALGIGTAYITTTGTTNTAEDPALDAGTLSVSSGSATACQGTGSVTVAASATASGCAGTTLYQYVLVNSSNNIIIGPQTSATFNLSGLAAGNYNIYGFIYKNTTDYNSAATTLAGLDNGGCYDATNAGLAVTINAPPTASTTPSNNTNCTAPFNGSIILTSNGTSFSWSNGSTAQHPTGLNGGTYTVTVTSASGCTNTASATVNNTLTPPTASATPTNNTNCSAPFNGSITLTSNGASFAWSNGSTAQNPTGLGAGTYTVTVTALNGCTNTASTSVSTIPNLPTASTTPSNNTNCNAPFNGSITLTSNGTSFLWSNGSTAQNPTGLNAGTYTVTITGANGCSNTASATVNSLLTPPTASTIPSNNNSCAVPFNGSITLSSDGATFLWSNGSTVQNPTGLNGGTYSVTVTGANGCTNTASATVSTIPNSPTASTNTTNNTRCAAPFTGIVTLTSNGTTFLWSNGSTVQSPSALNGGTYTVTITGSNGCTNTASASVVNSLTPPAATAVANDNTSCTSPNGNIILMSGGSFLWSNGSTAQNPTGLDAGTYTVTITGSNGCTNTASATVNNTPTQPTATATAVGGDNTRCAAPFTGGIVLTSNGTTFLWSNGSTDKSPVALNGGTYTVTVTDANGCTNTASSTVNNTLTPPTASAVASNNTSCTSPNGSIALTSTGISFLWSNGSTAQSPSALNGGTYTVTVTGPNGCTNTASAIVNNTLTPPTASATPTSNTNCTSPFNGSITLTSNGTSFAWSNGSTAQNPTGLGAGAYTVTVTAVNGCTNTTSASVSTTPNLPTASTTPSNNTNCTAPFNGSITLTSNGTSFLWSNGSTAQSPIALNGGTYTVTITGANGCSNTASATVNNTLTPPTASATPTNNTACFAPFTGSVTLTTTGTSFLWSNGSTTQNLTGLSGGTYTVTVTRTNGCSSTTSVTLTNTVAPPTAVATAVNNTSCSAPFNGGITLTSNGTNFVWSNGLTTQNLTGLSSGTFTVTVTGAGSCTNSASATVANTATGCCSANGGAVNTSSSICPGTPITVQGSGFTSGNVGGATYNFYYVLVNTATGQVVAVSPVNPGASYSFTGFTTVGNYAVYGYSFKATPLPAGGIIPVVGTLLSSLADNTTSPNCRDLSVAANVTISAPVVALSGGVSNTDEGNGGTGLFPYNTHIITISGGSMPYTFNWNNSGYVRYDIFYTDSGAIITIYYTDISTWALTVSDNNSCTSSSLVLGTGVGAILNIIDFVVTGANSSNTGGAVNITVVGGSCGGNYTYQWSGPNNFTATTQDISNVPSGWYNVTVTCGGQNTQGWYWVPSRRRGRTKVEEPNVSLGVQPNPFAETTSVTFVSETDDFANLRVYDMSGKEVVSLFSGAVVAGKVYELPLSAAFLPNGVYVAQLTTHSGGVYEHKVLITR